MREYPELLPSHEGTEKVLESAAYIFVQVLLWNSFQVSEL